MSSGIHKIIDQQIKRWEYEAENRRAAAERRALRPALVRPCITITGMFGSGGGEIAQRLASSLGYEIFDREILEVLTREGHFRAQILETLDQRDRSSLELWVDGLLHGAIVDKGDYLRTLVHVLGVIATHGHAIVIGRGANFILDPANALFVRVVAPLAQRIETIAKLRALPHAEAEALVHRIDHERAAYIQHHFHHDIDDPRVYDLSLNASRIGIEAAVDLIQRSLRWKLGGRADVQF